MSAFPVAKAKTSKNTPRGITKEGYYQRDTAPKDMIANPPASPVRRHHVRRARRPEDPRGQRDQLLQQLGSRLREHLHHHDEGHRRLGRHERQRRPHLPRRRRVAGLSPRISGSRVAADVNQRANAG